MKHLPLASSVLLLTSVLFVEAREPTELEQYYLELINRARINPPGEVARLSGETWGDEGFPATPDLNEGPPSETITSAAKQPLAFSGELIDSASSYSDLLLANEKFGHFENGTSQSRMAAAGYPFGHTYGTGENLALTTSTGSHPVDTERAEDHHANLFIDNNVAGRGHRINILNDSFREVGIAIRADSDLESFFPPTPSGNVFISDVLSTQNFAYSNDRVFVTGVIYNDTNFNSFYDVGESAGQLDLEVENSSNAVVASGMSFGSGGYSINMSGLAAGNYTLIAKNAINETATVMFTWNNATNVKADIVDPVFSIPPVIPPPAPTVHPTVTYRPDVMIGSSVNNLKGDNVYSANPKLQKATQKTKSKKAINLFVSFQNDGNFADRYSIAGNKGNQYIRLKYRDLSTGANVTAAIASRLTIDLGMGESTAYQIQAKPSRRAVGRKAKIFFEVRCSSVTDASKTDSVQGTVISKIRRK